MDNSSDSEVNEILDAAREIMRKEGVASLNLQKIAQHVGMKSTLLYNLLFNRFPDINAIYDELFAIGMRQYREDFESIFLNMGQRGMVSTILWKPIYRMQFIIKKYIN